MRTDLLSRDAVDVAPSLLGAVIETGTVAVRLTEVEAYGGVDVDPGSHAFRRQTPRNATMFGRPGLLYQYFSYGSHWLLNCVTGPEGSAGAVLLRAGEVVEGIECARGRRPTARSDHHLARGPALLARALGLNVGGFDGVDLLDPRSPVRLHLGRTWSRSLIAESPRTGVSGAGASLPWRFYVAGNPTVSAYRAAGR